MDRIEARRLADTTPQEGGRTMSEDYFHPGDDPAEADGWETMYFDEPPRERAVRELAALRDGERTALDTRNREICERRANGETARELAAEFELSAAQVRRIVNGDPSGRSSGTSIKGYRAVPNRPEHPSRLRAVPDEPTAEVLPAEWPDWWADLDAEYERPEPIATTAEGKPLLLARRLHLLFGAQSTGKSTITLEWCAQVVGGGGAAIFLSAEMNPPGIRQRLDEMGRSEMTDNDNFRAIYTPTAYRGGDPDSNRPPDIDRAKEWAAAVIAEGRDLLIALDSASRLGGATNDADDYIKWLNRLVIPWLELGAAVVLVDHVNKRRKDDEVDLVYGPRGTGSKLDQTDIAYNAITLTPWSTSTKGATALKVSKDRYMDTGTPDGSTLAVVETTPEGDHHFSVTMRNPTAPEHRQNKQANDKATKQRAWRDHFINYLKANPDPITKHKLAATTKGRAQDKKDTIEEMIEAGDLFRDGNNNITLPDPTRVPGGNNPLPGPTPDPGTREHQPEHPPE